MRSGMAASASSARGALVTLGQGVDLLELVAHRPEHRGAVGVDERLVEPAEPHAAGEVADDREAQLGGGHQAVEQLARRGLVGRRRGRLDEPALEDRGGHRHLGGRALLGEEHPEHRPLEGLAALDAGDAVVAQHPLEPPDEVGRQAHRARGRGSAGRCGSARAGCAPGSRRAPPRPPAGCGSARRSRRRRSSRSISSVTGERPAAASSSRAGEVAGQGAASRGRGRGRSRAASPTGRPGRARPARPTSPSTTSAGRSRSGASAAASAAGLDGAAGGLEPGERGTGLDLAAGGDVQLLEPRGERRRQHRLHLHALEHEHRRAGGHLVTHRERRGDDECRCGRTQHAALVAADPVGDTVDLDELHRAVRRR